MVLIANIGWGLFVIAAVPALNLAVAIRNQSAVTRSLVDRSDSLCAQEQRKDLHQNDDF